MRRIEKMDYYPDKHANNYYVITCPYCGARTKAQVRGYHARGRRCCKCKALFKDDMARLEGGFDARLPSTED